jgi:hypothetical protein
MSLNKNTSSQNVTALTQDDSPLTASPANDKRLSFKEVYDLFVAPGDMSPKSSSLFVAATVKRGANTSPSTSLSPSHNLLLKRNKAIDLMSAGHPQEEDQLQQAAARAYIISKQKKTSLSSFHQSMITRSNPNTTDILPRTLNYTNAEQNQLTISRMKITNKERRRKKQ